jgi:hypothetical protein
MSVNETSGARILSFENDVFVTTTSQFDVTSQVSYVNSLPSREHPLSSSLANGNLSYTRDFSRLRYQ